MSCVIAVRCFWKQIRVPLAVIENLQPETAAIPADRPERIVVSSREDKLRVALHLYNVEEDVDRLLDALGRRRDLLL